MWWNGRHAWLKIKYHWCAGSSPAIGTSGESPRTVSRSDFSGRDFCFHAYSLLFSLRYWTSSKIDESARQEIVGHKVNNISTGISTSPETENHCMTNFFASCSTPQFPGKSFLSYKIKLPIFKINNNNMFKLFKSHKIHKHSAKPTFSLFLYWQKYDYDV